MTDDAEGQDEVLAFLADPATYGSGGQEVRRIDTHAASVFLTGDRALKIKRAVRFAFLDYSTLGKRKDACAAELAVNASYAPEIYRGLVAITRGADGSLALGGHGKPVEWAVEMRRFDETCTLDHRIDAINETLADALGRAVALAHDKAPVVEATPWMAALATYLDQNVSAFGDRPDLFEPAAASALDRLSRRTYERIRPLLEARGKLGRVRRGHGDLHLGNIVLIACRPVLFDAIEFDPLIAAGDVLYDLAFLLMDLSERSLAQASNIVLNRYLVATRHIEDYDGLGLLPFFLSLRAAIRAKVTAARMERADAATQREIARAARAYFVFAGRAITPAEPQLIAVGGLSGSGKSHLARALAPHIAPIPGAVLVRSNVERKALFDAAETDKLPAAAYTPAASARVYATVHEKARRILAAGHSAIVDAVFAQPQERAAIAAVAKSADVRFRGMFLGADLAVRIGRIGGRARDASDADADVARAQERYDIGTLDWARIDASGTPTQTLALARAALAA